MIKSVITLSSEFLFQSAYILNNIKGCNKTKRDVTFGNKLSTAANASVALPKIMRRDKK